MAPPASDDPGARLLEAVAPDVAEVVARLEATARTTPALDADLRTAAARTVLEANGLAAPGPALDRSSPALRFAEQFAVDVSNVTDEQRAGLASALGADAFTFAQVVWIVDVIGRTRAVLGALAGTEPTDPGPTEVLDGGSGEPPYEDPWTGVQALLDGVPGLQAVDPITTDLVRLRLAGHHRCRLCRSLRSRSALVAGAEEERYLAVDGDDAGRAPALQAALDLVDAFAWTPGAVPADVIDRVRASWDPAQQVELVLDTARNAANKLAVAFGADDPHVTEGFEVFDVAPDGTVTYGLTAP